MAHRQKVYFFFFSFLFIVLLNVAPALSKTTTNDIEFDNIDIREIVPERVLQIALKNSRNTPVWQKEWMKARQALRLKELGAAIKLYRKLLEKRSNIELARWEYCQVLSLNKNYDEAEQQLGLLRLSDPSRNDYQLFAAKLSLAQGKNKLAAHHFGTVLERAPTGAFAAQAIAGLSESLRRQGKKDLAFSLEEQRAQQPKNENSSALFKDALAVGSSRKVLWHLEQHLIRYHNLHTLQNSQLQRGIILLADLTGKDFLQRRISHSAIKMQNLLYKELLIRTPYDNVIRQDYINFLLVQQRFLEGLHHLEILLELKPSADNMLVAANLAAGKANSPERAFYWYRRYKQMLLGQVLSESSDKKERVSSIELTIKELHKHIAITLLAPLSKEKLQQNWANFLWNKLEMYSHSMYDERHPIFLAMVDILISQGQGSQKGKREKQKRKAVYNKAKDLLLVLQQRNIPPRQTAIRLATIYQAEKDWEKASEVLRTLPNEDRNAEYYQLLATFELQRGNEWAAAENYSHFLNFKPKNDRARRTAMSLYGATGLIEHEKKLFSYYLKESKECKNLAEILPPSRLLPSLLLHLYWLAVNKEHKSLRRIANWGIMLYPQDLYFQGEIRLFEAELMRRNGKLQEAERLLRQQLNYKVFTGRTLLALARTTADMRLHVEAREWLDFLKATNYDDEKSVKFAAFEKLIRLRMEVYSGSKKRLHNVPEVLSLFQGVEPKETIFSADIRREVMELCALEMKSRLSKERSQIPKELENDFCSQNFANNLRFVPWGDMPNIANITKNYTSTLQEEVSIPDGAIVQNRELTPLSAKLSDIRNALSQGKYAVALKNGQETYKKYPNSTLAALLLIKAKAGSGNIAAVEPLLEDAKYILDSEEYCSSWIDNATQNGAYDLALKRFYFCYGKSGCKSDKSKNKFQKNLEETTLAAQLFAEGQPQLALQLARLLWRSEGKTEKKELALAVYRTILGRTSVDKAAHLYREEVGKELPGVGDWTYLPRSLNDIVLNLLPRGKRERETLAALLIPRILLDSRGQPMGQLLAHSVRDYRTLLRANLEYDARLATYEKRYRYAEKSLRYLVNGKKMIEGSKDISLALMEDLATVYQQTREFQKEALLKKKMRALGSTLDFVRYFRDDRGESEIREDKTLRPLADFSTSLLTLDGISRYRNMERRAIRPGFRFRSGDEKEFYFYLERVYYSAVSDQQEERHLSSLSSNIFGVDITMQLGEADFAGGVSTNLFDDGGGINLLYHAEIERQFGGQLTAGASWRRSEVIDSLKSVSLRTLKDTAQLSLAIETPVGVGLGGDIAWNMRTDGNNGTQLHGFLSHTSFYKTSELEWRYDGLWLQNELSQKSYVIVEEEREKRNYTFTDEVDSYWSPAIYNRHQITLRYKHHFNRFFKKVDVGKNAKSKDCIDNSTVAARNSPKTNYFAVLAGSGIEESGSPFYIAGVDIFVEIAPSFLLQSRLGISSNDMDTTKDFFLGLQYRW